MGFIQFIANLLKDPRAADRRLDRNGRGANTWLCFSNRLH